MSLLFCSTKDFLLGPRLANKRMPTAISRLPKLVSLWLPHTAPICLCHITLITQNSEVCPYTNHVHVSISSLLARVIFEVFSDLTFKSWTFRYCRWRYSLLDQKNKHTRRWHLLSINQIHLLVFGWFIMHHCKSTNDSFICSCFDLFQIE